MGKFQTAMMTREGMELLVKAQLGGAGITFTRGVSGAGVYGEDDNLEEMTALKDEKQSFPINRVRQNSSSSVSVRFVITNKTASSGELAQGYDVNEIGVYAKIGSGDEVLYAVAQAEVPDYLPAYDELMPASITVDLYCDVGNADNVVIQAAEGVYALAEDLDMYVPKADIVQTTGTGTTNVMSQKAVTDALASICDTDDHTIYVNASSGNDSTGNVSSAKPYKTLQAAYEAIPDYWLGKVTISLNTGDYNLESSGSPKINVLDTRTVQKQCSEIRIVGTASMTADGTRLYGGIYLTGKPKYVFEKVWIFAPYQKATEEKTLINIGSRVTADFNNSQIFGSSSSTVYDGTLMQTQPGSYSTLQDVSLTKGGSGVMTTGGIVLMGNIIFRDTMDGTSAKRCLLSYAGGLIVCAGENQSSLGLSYKSGGAIIFNGTMQ